MESPPSIGHDLAGHVGGAGQRQDHLGHVLGLPRALQRRHLPHHLAHEVPVRGPRRVDQPGRHGVDPHLGPDHLGQEHRHVVDGRLARRVGDGGAGRTQARHRGHVDDGPVGASRRAGRAATVMAHVPKTLTSKMRRHTSTEAASTSWCGIRAVVPALFTRMSRRPQRSSAAATRRGGHGGLGDVALDVEGVGQRRGDGLALGDRAGRVDEHSRPRGGEGAGRRVADPARRAGDGDDLAVQWRAAHRRAVTAGRSPSWPTTPGRAGGR